jgi:AbrB family looped-hinge helix DNA binding protein
VNAIVTLDKAGRLILPKAVRDELHLAAGDTLKLEIQGERLVLSPVSTPVGLQREHGFWVYHTGKVIDLDIPDLIEQVREERDRTSISGEE